MFAPAELETSSLETVRRCCSFGIDGKEKTSKSSGNRTHTSDDEKIARKKAKKTLNGELCTSTEELGYSEGNVAPIHSEVPLIFEDPVEPRLEPKIPDEPKE